MPPVGSPITVPMGKRRAWWFLGAVCCFTKRLVDAETVSPTFSSEGVVFIPLV
jgi:hypothetical protein